MIPKPEEITLDVINEKPKEETYYDILKISHNATISEVVAAYHTAKNTFSHESVATYSLFNDTEIGGILEKLEEAFRTLSNIEKKAEYDRLLALKAQNGDLSTMSEFELKQRASLKIKRKDQKTEDSPIEFTPLPNPYPGRTSGSVLKEIRERRGISVEEVTKVTKIPPRFIRAIEDHNVRELPARVYMQGFVKNLATLYRLDPNLVMKSYLDYIDSH